MGGCRCNFRQCHVSSDKFPRMHLFRFPLKEPERFKKWMQYSQMERMVEFTETRKRNTAICARHFRNECFMNYKMDKLVPSAVPTLMRLSKTQALDFELDIEKGVLVTLEEPIFKHLIPPENFESPLHLENDRKLMEILNVVQKQQKTSTEIKEYIEYIDVGDEEGERFMLEKPTIPSSNTVEILETIQFLGPTFKRSREYVKDVVETNLVDNTSVKKFKILNSAQNPIVKENKNETTIILTSRPDQNDSSNHIIISDDIDFIDSSNMPQPNANVFSAATNKNEVDDENIEFIQIHKEDTESLHDLTSLDSDSTVVQLKTDAQYFEESIKQQILSEQNETFVFKKQTEEIERLQLKISSLEKENLALKEISKETNELRKTVLTLTAENNRMKNILKEHKALKEKIAEYGEENRKLKEDNSGMTLLQAELLSRQQENKELKKIVENIKTTESGLKEEGASNEDKLKKEINLLRKHVEIKEKRLSNANSQLLKLQADFNTMRNENENLIKRQNELEQLLLTANSQRSVTSEENSYKTLKTDFENLQMKHSDLEEKYWKLQALQNQEATVSTSLENSNEKMTIKPALTTTAASLTKAQLFNGIKRYLSSAMVSLLRMEMFGSSEREWKSDERQVAVDVLRLGEQVYKYFTDEWRFRLPPLRDVRNWLSQEIQMDNEEDL